jgi:hypothetical protein
MTATRPPDLCVPQEPGSPLGEAIASIVAERAIDRALANLWKLQREPSRNPYRQAGQPVIATGAGHTRSTAFSPPRTTTHASWTRARRSIAGGSPLDKARGELAQIERQRREVRAIVVSAKRAGPIGAGGDPRCESAEETGMK